MHESLLADIGLSIITAALVALPIYFLRLPLILAFIMAGVILGPQLGFNLVKDHNTISQISEIGLVLLLFILGLEINLKKLLQAGKSVLISSFLQISISFIGTILVFLYFKNESINHHIIYLAVACSLSSTLIVVKILSDRMDLESIASRITLGVLVIQDLFVIGFLAIQPNLNNLEFSVILQSILKVIALVSVSYIFGRWILPRLFRTVSRQPELMILTAMSWCFGLCGLAHLLQLSLEMGALVAGISIASYPYHLDVVSKISSLRDFFITLFFVSLGLQIPMPNLNVIQMSLLLTGLIYLTRIISLFPILNHLGYARRISFLTTINLSQMSEFSIVIATIGLSLGHISQDIVSALVLTTVFTALLSSLAIPKSHDIYYYFDRLLQLLGFKDQLKTSHQSKETHSIKNAKEIVFLGFYRDASSLLFEMLKRNANEEFKNKLFVVDFNPEVHKELNNLKVPCAYGDISNQDTLTHLKLESAQLILCSLPDKILKGTTNLQLLRILKKIAPNACLILTAENLKMASELYENGAHYVYIPRQIGAYYLTDIIEKLQAHGKDSIKTQAIEFLKHRNEIIP